jgi:polyvinyl alcohol dehydrogenase (cytochrome)
MRWRNQVTQNDNFTMGCEPQFKSPNCPINSGPDYDFGASPILFTLKSGRQILLAGQKSGIAYGMDPDTGKTLWKTKVGSGSALGGIEWGIASDPGRLYVPVADTQLLISETPNVAPALVKPPGTPPGKPGVYAIDPATGKVLWSAPAPKAPCHYAGDRSGDYAKGGCIRAQSAPPSAIPGAVLEGGLDGWLRAYDAKTGKVIWVFSSTDQTYDTANAVKGQPGGGIDGVGGAPVVGNGMIYLMSGFNGASRTGGNGVNVLLALSPDGR